MFLSVEIHLSAIFIATKAYFLERGFHAMVIALGPDVDQIRLARVELDRWRDSVLVALKSETSVRAAVYRCDSTRLPLALRDRLTGALMGCDTVLEVEMVFACVQDHQLCS